MIPDEIDLPGDIRGAEPVADRRGIRTWKVTLAGGRVLAVKYGTGEARRLAQREATVLRTLSGHGYRHASGFYASGHTDAGTWIACTWCEAPTIYQAWRGVRVTNGPDDQVAALNATRSALASLAALHTIGWCHADLQPDHILVPASGPARLLDFALAQGPTPTEPAITYRGGMAHLAAPEIAAQILDTSPEHHVALTPAAEVYMLGAVLRTVWSGRWPYDYGSDQPSVREIYQRVRQDRQPRPTPEGWPRMAAIIRSAMDRQPTRRPTMAEILTILDGVEAQP
jgi:serine/threonine protein kinase